MNRVNIREPERDTAVAGDYDAVVCGGGPAGAAAAISAARRGARVCVLEAHGALGGIWTSGLLSWIVDWRNKAGLIPEIMQEMRNRDGLYYGSAYNAEKLKKLLEDMCLAEGVEIQYHTRTVAAVVEGQRLKYVVTESKSGRQAWTAPVFVDATGDGDLSAQAGCRFAFGREESGEAQPMSLMAIITGLRSEEVAQFLLNGDDVYGARGRKGRNPARELLLEEMRRAGVAPSYRGPTIFQIDADLYALMANHEYDRDPMSARSVTDATIHARAELHGLVDGLKALGGPWRDLRIVSTAEQIGVREARRVLGLYTISVEDLLEGRKQPDGICRVTNWVDIHSTDPAKGKSYGSDGITMKPFDIPIRSLIAKDVQGLMMAGRCISGDFYAHASYRVTGNVVTMGQACGVVAALAASSDRLPQEVPIEEARSFLPRAVDDGGKLTPEEMVVEQP
jgi:hypothetical protein